MKVSVAACLLLASSAAAFAPKQPAFATRAHPLRMADEAEAAPPTPPPPPPAAPAAKEAPGGALVPIKDETVEFTAGIIGGVAGFAVGGPILGAIGAAAANYVSKVDGDVTDVVQAVSKSSIQIFNYLAGLDQKYEVLDNAKSSLEKSLDKLKSQENVDRDVVEQVEKALANTNKKIKEINDEYDLVGGGVTALGIVGDLVEQVVQKAGELNEEYQLTSKAKQALSNAVDKAREAAKDAAR